MSDLFRLSLRAAAVLMELVIRPALSFPVALFQCLENTREAERILELHRQCPCVMDPFTHSFLSHYNSVAALRSEEAQTILHTLALFSVGNTFNIERLHSTHATRSRHRVTHQMSLGELALWHQGLAQAQWIPKPQVGIQNVGQKKNVDVFFTGGAAKLMQYRNSVLSPKQRQPKPNLVFPDVRCRLERSIGWSTWEVVLRVCFDALCSFLGSQFK